MPQHFGQTEEQRQAAFQAAGLTPRQQEQVRAGVPSGLPGAITSEALAPTIAPVITPAAPIPVPDVSKVPVTEPPKPEVPNVGIDLNRRLEETLARVEGKDVTKEVKVSTAEQQRELNEINTQIRFHQAQALARQNEALKSGETLAFSTGQAAEVARTDAVRALELSALAQAKQGNLALATDLSTSAIEEKYKTEEQNLRIQRANIINNYDNFSASEKKRADALLLRLDKQDEFVKRQKEKEKDLQEIGNKAVVAGASLVDVQKAIATGDTVKASSLLAPFLEKPTGDIGEFENAKAKGLIPQSMGFFEYIQKKGAAGRKGEDTGGLTPIDLVAYAQQWASTGKIPTELPKGSFGAVSQFAKEMPKQEGTIIDVNTGVKPDISDARIDGLAALYDISKKTEDLKLLQKERIGGVVAGVTGKIFGSAAQQRYIDLRTEIIDLLARARTGAALTIQEEKFYTDQLPGRFTEAFFLGPSAQKRLDNFATKINGTLDTKLKANSASIVGFSTIKLGEKEYKVGDIIEVNGIKGRVLSDGSIASIQ